MKDINHTFVKATALKKNTQQNCKLPISEGIYRLAGEINKQGRNCNSV